MIIKRLLDYIILQLLICKIGIIRKISNFIGLLRGLNELIHVQLNKACQIVNAIKCWLLNNCLNIYLKFYVFICIFQFNITISPILCHIIFIFSIIFILSHFFFHISPRVQESWDLNGEFSWRIAVTKMAYLTLFCGFGCKARVSVPG